MKVKDLWPKKEKAESEFEKLQKLEITLRNNPELCREIEKAAGVTWDVHVLIKEARMTYCDVVYEIRNKIMDAEIV